MWDDPIVAEVRKTRVEHAVKFHYDIEAIFRDLKEKEKNSKRTYLRCSPRICQPAVCDSHSQDVVE